VNCNIAEPDSLPSPYSVSPASNSVTAIQQIFSTPSEAGFLQGTALLPWNTRLTLGAPGVALVLRRPHQLHAARAVQHPVNRHVVTLGYAEYTQMPSVLSWNAGLLNVLNQKNFYASIWEPRAGASIPTEQDQMPRFPKGAVKLTS